MKSFGIAAGVLNILIEISLVLQCLSVHTAVPNVKLCRHFLSGDDAKKSTENVQETFSEQCPPSPSAFGIFHVHTEAEEEEITNLTFLVCWNKDVKRMALHFDTNVSIGGVQSSPLKLLRTCGTNNDTVYITRQTFVNNNMYQLVLNLPVTNHHSYTFKAFYDHKRQVHIHGQHKVVQYRYRPNFRRRKRSTEKNVNVNDIETCGNTRGCYRHGKTDCEHFACDYFLSYKYSKSSNNIDLEMSALSDGWVAVGFSSDRSMGGDDLIVCSRRSPSSTVVEAKTYKNPYSHDPPAVQDNVVTMKQSVVKDGYIYCHVTVPVESPDRQELTNTWFQLYARGSVAADGQLEKHTTTPYVSKEMITMVVLKNIQSSSSSIYLVALSTVMVGPIFLWLFT